MTILYYAFFIFMLYRLLSKAYQFEAVSRWELRILPAFSLVMFVIHFAWTPAAFLLLLTIGLLSFLIARLQMRQIQIKETDQLDRFGRPIVLVQKNTSYLIGWGLVILIGVGLGILLNPEELSLSHILSKIFEEIRKEIFSLAFFTSRSDWYIWALSGLTNFCFTRLLMRENARIAEATRKHQPPCQKGGFLIE